jgi:hypothetical protein
MEGADAGDDFTDDVGADLAWSAVVRPYPDYATDSQPTRRIRVGAQAPTRISFRFTNSSMP